jgi:hypothetical protein
VTFRGVPRPTPARDTAFGGRNLAASLLIVNGAILDNTRAGLGPFASLVGRTVGTTDTALAHALGRVPNGVAMVFRNSSGGVLYDASTGTGAWTDTSITLRATVAGVYSFLIF